ncbi:hypothetical protein EVAR_51661_1 [Eumeta japonica]|uniref:Uncharacterized protein n=1 Tax=Eumeta variegata TaxID=151549 RepID=A0A4C1YD00_EUMVA|nr:hypothetical protein EVAR_51661_1 [Eumeta japonica]
MIHKYVDRRRRTRRNVVDGIGSFVRRIERRFIGEREPRAAAYRFAPVISYTILERQTRPSNSMCSRPPMDIRKSGRVTSTLLSSEIGIEYLIGEEWGDREEEGCVAMKEGMGFLRRVGL